MDSIRIKVAAMCKVFDEFWKKKSICAAVFSRKKQTICVEKSELNFEFQAKSQRFRRSDKYSPVFYRYQSFVDAETRETSFCIKRMSWPSSGPELCVVWLWKMPASGWGSLRELSSFVPWFEPYAFRDVSGAVPEWPWISGFMRKSSRRDNAPKMRFSVLLNSWDNFFVSLPSISWETWVM